MRVGLVSAKGSPGVTTAAVALTAAVGGVLVELDPSGGCVECWAGPQGEPGLIRVAASLRRGSPPTDVLDEHAVEVWPGVRAVLAPSSAVTAESTLVAISERFGPVLREHEGLVVVDGGRWSRSQVTTARLLGCDVVVVVVAPTVAGVEHAHGLVDPLVDVCSAPVVAVLVGDQPYRPDEVEEVLAMPVLGSLAWDRRGVRMLLSAGRTRGWMRCHLARSALGFVERLRRHVVEVRVGG